MAPKTRKADVETEIDGVPIVVKRLALVTPEILTAIVSEVGHRGLVGYLASELAGGVKQGGRLMGDSSARWYQDARKARRVVARFQPGICAVCATQPARFCGTCARSHFGAVVKSEPVKPSG